MSIKVLFVIAAFSLCVSCEFSAVTEPAKNPIVAKPQSVDKKTLKCLSETGSRYTQGSLLRDKKGVIVRCESGEWEPSTTK